MKPVSFRGGSIVLLTACLVFSAELPGDLALKFKNSGQLLYLSSTYAPFPHAKRQNGHNYHEQMFPKADHYCDSTIAVFIPAGLKTGAGVDIVVYFHGWYNHLDSVIRKFQIVDQFIQSRKNAILIIPQGPKNAPDSFGGKLEEQDGFKKMIDDILDNLSQNGRLKTPKVSNIILAGHSGAYRVISFILLRGGYTQSIREVYLFDALYGQTEKYAWWIDHYNGKLINIYTPDGGTKAESENLMTDLTAWQIPYLMVKETDLTINHLTSNRLIFIDSEQEHNDVVFRTNNFFRFLDSSLLKGIPH